MSLQRDLTFLFRTISAPHLRKHTLRTVLTLIGISSGVSAVVATSVVSDSAFRTFADATRATAGNAQIYVGNRGSGVPERLIDAIGTVDGVRSVSPLIHGKIDHADRQRDAVTLFGFDVLGDSAWAAQIPDGAISIPDELDFIAQPDSIVAARSFAADEGLRLGDTIDFLAPVGRRTLVIRGFVDDVGPIPLFSGRVVLMDLPAAQLLMGRDRKVDRIDVTIEESDSVPSMITKIDAVVAGAGFVRETTMLGRRAEDALRTMRLIIDRPGIMAVIVGFFIIFHTMSVSVTQRRSELSLLDALGYTPRTLLIWLGLEGAMLGLFGSLLGLGGGIALGAFALDYFTVGVKAWIQLPSPQLHITARGVGSALVAGIVTSVVATLSAGRRWFARRAAAPSSKRKHAGTCRQIGVPTALALGGVATTWAMIAFIPDEMGETGTSAYVNSVGVLTIAALGMFAPLICLLTGVAITKLGHGLGRLPLVFAGGLLRRDPATPTAVIVAIVLSLGWTLGDATFINSIRSTWLGWMDTHRRFDFTVEAGSGSSLDLLTARPLTGELESAVRSAPGVEDILPIRLLEGLFRDRTIVIQGIGRGRLFDDSAPSNWQTIAPGFWRGEGVLVSDHFARWAKLEAGDLLPLPTPSGLQRFPILGRFSDTSGGDMGTVAMSLDRYRELWRDEHLSVILVEIEETADRAAVQRELRDRSAPYGAVATSYTDFRQQLAALVDAAFSGTYALVLIAFAVSFIGIINFLITAAIDRQSWYTTFSALGFSATRVVLIVAGEGVLLAVAGAGIGVVAGIAMSHVMVYFTIPVVTGWVFDYHLPVAAYVAAAAGAILLGAVAGLLPGLQAIRTGAPRMPPAVRQL